MRKPRARQLASKLWIVFGDGVKGTGITLDAAWFSWMLEKGIC